MHLKCIYAHLESLVGLLPTHDFSTVLSQHQETPFAVIAIIEFNNIRMEC